MGLCPPLAPVQNHFFYIFILFIYLYIIYYIKQTCQINPAKNAPKKPKNVATSGHSNINAASTANIPKVFHNVSIAHGVEPPVNLHAVGWGLTGVYPCAVGGGSRGFTPVQKIETF
jgi:hypothetical protein